ncbi:MAG: hypothetical protein LOD91_02825 [Limnochordales bacterium]|nr:hypothetical protein [Limnochordales bacterium]
MRLAREELEALWDAAEEAAAARHLEQFGGLVKLLLGYLLLETFGPEYLSLIPDSIGEPSPHRLRTARPYFFDALRAEDPEEARDFAQQCLQLAVPKVQRIWRQASLPFRPRPGESIL